MVNIQDGKAATIEEELEAVREKWGIPMAKVTGSGSDGEAVMVGCREGVATRLKRLNPELLSVHCGAHHLSLAASQAANSVSYLQKFNSHLTTIFYFFKNSPVRESGLHTLQEILDKPVLTLKIS